MNGIHDIEQVRALGERFGGLAEVASRDGFKVVHARRSAR